MLYSITNELIFEMIDRYHDYGGEVYTIDGVLNDNYILTAEGKKTVVIKEHYLSDWSSCNVIRFYNKCPKKYERVIEMLNDGDTTKAEKLFFA